MSTASNFYLTRPFTFEQTSDFSRASIATYYDSDGVLQTAAIDEIRLNYDPSDLTAPPTWLIEGASTNLVTYSEEFDDASWSKSNATITPNSAVAPDGTTTMDKLVENTSNAQHYVEKAISFSLGQQYAFSIYAKPAERSFLRIQFSAAPWAQQQVIIFDLSNKLVIVLSGSPVGSIQDIGNGVYRCVLITPEVTVATTGTNQIQLYNGSTSIYTGDGISGLYIWGAQIEAASSPTSYIKTTAATATRSADLLGDALTSSVSEDDYPEYDAGDTYALKYRVISLTTHKVYESLQDGNMGNPLPDDGVGSNDYWITVGATNRWKMFDYYNSSQTENADSIIVQVQVDSRPNAVFFGNVEATEITIVQYDSIGNLVFSDTYSMIENTGTPSYYSWFLSQLRRKVDLFVTGLQPYAGGKVYARISNIGATAKCGTMLIGFAENIGLTQLGANVGITDFSVKRQNDFGDFEILERAFNKKGEFNIFVDNAGIDRLQNNLASVRATAILYVGSTAYACTFVYGFFRDFNIVITYPEHSLVNIQVEGLT